MLKVAARQFPVTVHFSRETVHGDYLGAAKKKVLAIHRKLPPGGVLVFLTGQREVDQLCAKLRAAHPPPPPGTTGGNRGGRGATGGGARDRRRVENGPRDIREDADDLPGLDAPTRTPRMETGRTNGTAEAKTPTKTPKTSAGRDDFDDASDHDDSASDVSEEDEVVHAGEGVDPEEAAAAEADWVRAHAPTTAAAAAAATRPAGTSLATTGRDIFTSFLCTRCSSGFTRARVRPSPSRFAIGGGGDERPTETSFDHPGVRYVVDCGREKRRRQRRRRHPRRRGGAARRVSLASPWSG